MDYKKTKENLQTYLEGKTDPDEIRIITDSIKCLEEATASDEAKSALIAKQAAELKEFFLNTPIKREADVVPPPSDEPKQPRSFDEVLKSVLEKDRNK